VEADDLDLALAQRETDLGLLVALVRMREPVALVEDVKDKRRHHASEQERERNVVMETLPGGELQHVRFHVAIDQG
jgi:hypothetical protein